MRQLLLITRKYLRSFLKCRLYFLKIEVKHCSYKKSAVLNSVTLMQKSAMSKNSVTFTNLEAVARSLFRSSFEANLEAAPYLSVFGLNAGKYRPEKTPYLNTFHAV